MKLTPENLQFIDNYLQNNEVVFVDIRLEMLDHIATAVEQKMELETIDFYDAFKAYMLEHKKEIMKSNKPDALYFKPILKFGMFLLKPMSLVLAPLAFLINYYLLKIIDNQYFNTYFILSFFVLLIPINIARIYFLKRKRFFYLEQNGTILFLLIQINHFFNFSVRSSDASLYINSTMLFLVLSYVFFYYRELAIIQIQKSTTIGMKLTPEQIDQLYTFTRQHYVEWYDVQSELVDHLANAIETEWELNPNRTFEEVLHSEFKKFGIFGFMVVVEEKQKMLSKRYEKLIWNYYKEYFKLPKIILTLSAIFLIFTISRNIEDGDSILLIVFLLIYVWGCFEAFVQSRKIKKKQKTTEKKWLFENMIDNNIFVMFLVFSPINLFRVLDYLGREDWSTLYFLICSIIIVVFSLYAYVRMKTIPPLIAKELSQLYPEYI